MGIQGHVRAVAAVFQGWYAEVTTIIDGVMFYVNTLVKVFQSWYAETGSVIGGIMGALGALELMVPSLQPVVAVIKDIVTWVQTNLPLALSVLSGIWSEVWGAITTTFSTATAFILPKLR